MPKRDGYVDLDIQNLLHSVADHFDLEDQAVRERQIRTWRKMKLMWNSFTNVWYDEVAHDWRIWDYTQSQEINDDQAYYDKNVNVFRAYLESIIAALSVTVPTVTCYPDDAQNNLDLQTAKAGDKIAQLISRHNEVSYLWLHALYIFCTEGLIACYNYPKEDKRFGTYESKDYEEETQYQYICPNCKAPIDPDMMDSGANGTAVNVKVAEFIKNQETDEFMPGPDDVDLHYKYQQNPSELICPSCAMELDPNLAKTPFVVTRMVGVTTKAKTRQCLEVYGGLNVKVPNYVRSQEECPYLRYSYEVHYSVALQDYPHLVDEIGGGSPQALAGMHDPYETWGRLSPQYNGEYPINNVTINKYWFRPAAFNVLPKEDAERLKKLFPDGCKFVKIQEIFAWAENEALDDCWTLSKNPLSDYLHHDPLGLLLTSIQDIVNEIISLILQTMEHGISQGFADPSVLNFKKYRETEVRPGDIFPAIAKAGRSLNEFFHEIKTANLSPEVVPFYQMVQELGQLTSGAAPAIFGGQLEGSKTASEYSMSRAQALQRLQTPWKMLLIWWKTIFGKVIPMYIKTVQDDEKFVEKTKDGSFINTFIRKAELEGKLGSVEIEGNENLPITWSQQKDVLMQLLQASNPLLMQIIMDPANIPYVRQALGLVDIEIPGEADRNKEFEEIQQLLDSEPIVVPGMMGMEEMPSVEVDPDLDNHQVASQIDRNWLISEAGRLAKLENPLGYKNVLLHFKMHLQFLQLQMMQQQHDAAVAAGEEPGDEESQGQNGAGARPKEQEDSDGNRATIQ